MNCIDGPLKPLTGVRRCPEQHRLPATIMLRLQDAVQHGQTFNQAVTRLQMD